MLLTQLLGNLPGLVQFVGSHSNRHQPRYQFPTLPGFPRGRPRIDVGRRSAYVLVMRNLICCLILTAVVLVVQYGLHQLAHSVELATFLEFCIAAVAVQVAIAFAWS
jgi:hypothetical protein